MMCSEFKSFTAFAAVIRNYFLQIEWKLTACDEDSWVDQPVALLAEPLSGWRFELLVQKDYNICRLVQGFHILQYVGIWPKNIDQLQLLPILGIHYRV
jgi:hypothetical protein